MDYEFMPFVHEERYKANTSIASSVFDVLRSAIVTMKLLPGDSLSEAEVAKQLDVSRQPVREAFIQLSKIGLLNIVPQKGSYVVKICIRDVQNARFIREAIEVAIVQRACLAAKKRDIETIFSLISEQEVAEAGNDQELFLRLDDAFHQAIAKSADCLYGWHIVEDLKAQIDRVRFLSFPTATPLKKIIDQHFRIGRAIRKGDQGAASDAMKVHLNEILTSLPLLATKNREMFSQDSHL